MKWTLQFSLRTKLTALLAGLLALVAIVLLVILPPKISKTIHLWSHRRAEAVSLILSNAVAPGLDFDDASHVASQLEGLARAPGALYAAVRYSNGEILSSWRKKEVPKPSAVYLHWSDVPKVIVDNNILRVEVAVNTASGQRGLLQVGFSMTELENELQSSYVLIGVLALGVFIIGSAAAFLIGSVLSVPLRQMSNVALRLAGGDITGAENILTHCKLANYQDNSSNEVVRLATSFARMLVTLRTTTVSLQESAQTLTSSVNRLSNTNTVQSTGLKRQAESLLNAKGSAQHLRRTSEAAATQAHALLLVAQRSSNAGRMGEDSIHEALSGLNDIRGQVAEISQRVIGLGERISQAGIITFTVRELTDQSQLLAINASIEAARSGKHGRGFAVIAHQLRQLAQQSVDSTKQIQSILAELMLATSQVVSFTEAGKVQVEASAEQIHNSSERLRELSELASSTGEAVHQIATTVQQQDKGVDTIFESMTELSKMMDDTIKGLRAVNNAMEGVDKVARIVTEAARSFRT